MSSGGGSSSDRKERLAVFLKEIPRFASLTGFRHFTVYARNREEVVVTTCAFDNEALATSHLLPDSSASDLAPASPISHELPSVTSPSKARSKRIRFLIGAYKRYKRPMVWVRSDGVSLPGFVDKTQPLKLASTDAFKYQDIKLWDIVADLVTLSISPAPANPFEIDFEAFETMDPLERSLSTGAMVHFLRKIYLLSGSLTDVVADDLMKLINLHFLGYDDDDDRDDDLDDDRDDDLDDDAGLGTSDGAAAMLAVATPAKQLYRPASVTTPVGAGTQSQTTITPMGSPFS